MRFSVDELDFQGAERRTEMIMLGALDLVLAPVVVNVRLGDRSGHRCGREGVDDTCVAVDAQVGQIGGAQGWSIGACPLGHEE